MTIWFEREHRSALITGGSRGIGRGIATHLSQQGWTRTRVGRARVQLAQVHSELDIAAAVHIVAADQAVDAAVELHRRTFGSMNALILAAGVARPDRSRTIPRPRLDNRSRSTSGRRSCWPARRCRYCGRESQRVGQGARAS